MKSWIRTSCYQTTEPDTGEITHLPDFGGYETELLSALPEIAYSLAKINFPSDVLCRVAGPQAKVSAIVAAKGTLTDDEASTIIAKINPNSGLRNVDVRDGEVDMLAEAIGLNPHYERTKNGKYGRPLWEQEPQIIESVAKAMGVPISDKELDDIRRGRCDAHENVLSKLRQAKPPAV